VREAGELSSERERAADEKRRQARREFAEFCRLVFYFLILLVAVQWYVVETYEVDGPSMAPTLLNGDRIFVFKLPHVLSQFRLFNGVEAIKPNDIVVFYNPDDGHERYVKRVLAKGPQVRQTDTVDAKVRDGQNSIQERVRVRFEQGDVYVDRHRVSESYIAPEKNQLRETFPEVELGPGDYYVLGDYRDNSKDSRIFGPIDNRRIIGKAVFRYWPLNRVGLVQ
jgi:signal peptidase I